MIDPSSSKAARTKNDDLAIEVAWLHYVGGLTQAEISARRSISKATVHRLIKTAHENGDARVFVETDTQVSLEVEQTLCRAFGLKICRVAPSLGPDVAPEKRIEAVAALGAQTLMSHLEIHKNCVVGVGAGRTLGAFAKLFPRIKREEVEFVNLTGEFSVFKVGRSPEVIRRLAERTGGTGFSIAAPMIADSAADRRILLAQRGTQLAFSKLKMADIFFHGIGHLGEGSFLTEFNLVTKEELQHLRDLGVVADFSGNLLDKDGKRVDCDVNDRMVSCDLVTLSGKQNIAVAAGSEKAAAILSTLRSGFLAGLITDLDTALEIADLAGIEIASST